MNLKGRIVHCEAAEVRITVQQAVVTDERLTLDWNQDGRIGYLIAKSEGGSHFQGRYGYQHEKADYDCELTLFQARHEDLLYGTWRERGTDRQGSLLIRLPARTIEAHEPNVADTLLEGAAANPDNVKIPSSNVLPVAAAAAPAVVAASVAAPRAALPAHVPAKLILSSTQVDRLLSLTAEQFDAEDRRQIEQELLAAPVPALFKLSHNALAADLRALAAQMFADRYQAAPESSVPARKPRVTESPEMRAQKRRSSRHGKSR